LAVDTRPTKLAVLTRPFGFIEAVAEDRYPTVPRPITVLVRFACESIVTPTI
jgi:hypothetical protein